MMMMMNRRHTDPTASDWATGIRAARVVVTSRVASEPNNHPPASPWPVRRSVPPRRGRGAAGERSAERAARRSRRHGERIGERWPTSEAARRRSYPCAAAAPGHPSVTPRPLQWCSTEVPGETCTRVAPATLSSWTSFILIIWGSFEPELWEKSKIPNSS